MRRAVQYLDDANVPEDDRFMVMSPAEKNDKLGLDKWTNALYRGDQKPVNTGEIGREIYGLMPYMTTNLNAPAAGQAANFIGHRDFMALVQQRQPKMHLFYDIDFFTWKVAGETIYGEGELRDTFGVYVKGKS